MAFVYVGVRACCRGMSGLTKGMMIRLHLANAVQHHQQSLLPFQELKELKSNAIRSL